MPNMLLHGRKVLLPIDLMIGPIDCGLTKSSLEYVEHLRTVLPLVHDIARENLSASQQRQKRDFDVRAAEKKYTIGDLVILRDSSTVVGQSSKLRPPWKGPFLVIQVLSPSLIKIQGAKRDSVVHHDRLKFCHGEQDIPVWLRRARHELLGTDPEPETEVPVNGTLPEELLTGPDTSESSGSSDDD